MTWLYLLINLSVILFPATISFDKKMQFYRLWPSLFKAIVTVALFYIAFDIWFSFLGVWGFNPAYISGLTIVNLPIEEILFFFTVPFASVFLHYSIVFVFPDLKLNQRNAIFIAYIVLAIAIILILFNFNKLYTIYSALLVILSTIIAIRFLPKVLTTYFITFLMILVPFFIVNGLLTGSFIQGEIVWYNNAQNLNIRFFTIPVEDIGYGYSLILLNIILTNYFEKRKGKKNVQQINSRQ